MSETLGTEDVSAATCRPFKLGTTSVRTDFYFAIMHALEQCVENYYTTTSLQVEIVSLLLEAGAYRCLNNDNSLLFKAIRLGKKDIVELLLHHGADVDMMKHDEAPIHIAAQLGNLDILQILRKYGANLNQKGNSQEFSFGWSELPNYSSSSQQNCIGAKKSQMGSTALHLTVSYHYVKCAEFLLMKGCNVNERDEELKTPLHVAAYKGNHEMIQLLIKHGASISLKDQEKNYPFWYVLRPRNYTLPVLESLLYGLDINEGNEITGSTPLHYACRCKGEEMVRDLHSLGADYQLRDKQGFTPLMEAARGGQFSTVLFLLETFKDIEVNAVNCEGRSTLYFLLALQNNMLPLYKPDFSARKLQVLDTMIKYDADVNLPVEPEGNLVLLVTCQRDKEALDWLINHHADINMVYPNGDNAFLKAVETYSNYHTRHSLLESLIEENVDFINLSAIQGPQGLTPIQVAIQDENVALTYFLLEIGCSIKYVKTWLPSYLYFGKVQGLLEYMENEIFGIPASLKDMCRQPVLGALGPGKLKQKIDLLPYPDALKSFLYPMKYGQ